MTFVAHKTVALKQKKGYAVISRGLNFHKIYTYAYDLRPKLYEVMIDSGYFKDAILKDHVCSKGSYLDVVIHSKLNKSI